ncbi:hypothetical protein EVAR_91305_1 [Eumeta japonica]|uniref:Uncharacterized protein n=1 Tax=Eumeta variegata TaxID=151549 RepID=A0A4C1SQW3_EUMVA|nr:hypothetical protein EVAR_91305_1 [Eumeta japonica]
MYRQILVQPSDRQFQRILFQPGPDSPVENGNFGVNSAPYLAIRTLLQLASIPKGSINFENGDYTPEDCVEIHGFSDASKSAYCAAVYIRCRTASHTTFSNLLVAKSKVAPIQTVCLPRLELNGAVLLASLVNHVNANLGFNASNIYLWTDSSIVLGWLSKHHGDTSPVMITLQIWVHEDPGLRIYLKICYGGMDQNGFTNHPQNGQKPSKIR